MAIFSNVSRDDHTPSRMGESSFDFYDRVDGEPWEKMRDLLEDWFSRVGKRDAGDLGARLRSKDDRQFSSALLELYLHESLIRMGYDVECHPVSARTSNRPDFVARKGGRALFVEAHVPQASARSVSFKAQMSAAHDGLDRIDSPDFSLWIYVERSGREFLGARALRGKIERWIRTLDPDAPPPEMSEYPPNNTFESKDWRLKVIAKARPLARRGLAGRRTVTLFEDRRASGANDDRKLLGALGEKGSAYEVQDAPYLLALGSVSPTLSAATVRDTLFGRAWTGPTAPSTQMRPSALEHKFSGGYWSEGGSWRRHELSGVLFVTDLHPWSLPRAEHAIWEHPAPAFRLPELSIWGRVALADDGPITTRPQQAPLDLFGLDDAWPKW